MLLAKTLEEEKNADVKLTEIAVSHINVDAAHETINNIMYFITNFTVIKNAESLIWAFFFF
jgi:hypothetical protein